MKTKFGPAIVTAITLLWFFAGWKLYDQTSDYTGLRIMGAFILGGWASWVFIPRPPLFYAKPKKSPEVTSDPE